MEIVQAVKKLNSILRERLNFRRRPILCTSLYRNPMQASIFGGTFDQLFLWIFFIKLSQKMSLYLFYTMVQKSQKWPKTQIKGRGSCLKEARNEVENASFAQRSAHRDSRIWRPELIEPAAERKRRARGQRPTFKSAFPDPQILPQCNISSNYPL